ncbi:MAG: ribosomal protein S18-alanine N-acetyltransferase, partial [Acidobacteriota bacterium]
MAVLQKIREFFITSEIVSDVIIPAPATTYEIRSLTEIQLKEVWKLNQRCFTNGENYPKSTLSYLLSAPNTLSYRIVTPKDEMAGFVFVTVQEGTAHLTTIGVAPEHRRRGLAQMLINHIENALRIREISMISLEVRVSNVGAQYLYRQLDYAIMQRLNGYYSNGED